MAEWTTAYVNSLPDSAFACPKQRKYPHHDKSGALDRPHLRAALSRVGDPSNEQCGKGHLQAHAKEAGMGQKADYLKAEQLSTAKWRVLAIPFGGPFSGKDLDGEFFSPKTDIKADWFDRRPLVWHHNLDRTMKADPVMGTADDLEQLADGWWSTLWLNRSHQYWTQVDELLRAGKVYGSSGALPNFVQRDAKTGEILVWPYIEQTLTPTPANPYSVVLAAKAVDHFDAAGIGLSPAVRGLLTDLEGPTADLPGDLPSGGELAAKRERLSGDLDALLERLKTI